METSETMVLLSFNLNHLVSPQGNVSKRCRQNGKRCRLWSNCSFCSLIWVCTVCPDLSFRKLTVMFLSFRTDRSGQTVQTHIRSSLIRVYTVCTSLCIVWMHHSKETPSCSTFRVITINFWVSEILRFLR